MRGRAAQPADAPGVPAAEDEEERGQRVLAVLNRREAQAIGGKYWSAGGQVQR